MELMKNGEIAREGTRRGKPSPPNKQPLNALEMLKQFNMVLAVGSCGELWPVPCGLALAIIQAETLKTGLFCKWDVISSQIGRNSNNGKYVSILESKGLIFKPKKDAYLLTVEGELLLKDIISRLTQILQSKPTKPKAPRRKVRRQPPPIETFNELVSEVLSKPGLNVRVKYSLLRALGLSTPKAKAALKQLQPMKNTERIKPVLKAIISDLVNKSEPTK